MRAIESKILSPGFGALALVLALACGGGGGTPTDPFATPFTITASAGANGSISPSGSVQVRQGASQTFSITPDSGYAVSRVTVDGSSVGGVGSYTFSNITTDHSINATFSGSTNFAPSGTAYGWYNNTSATSDSNRTALPGLNDNDLTLDIAISNGDNPNAWEAAGVVFVNTSYVSMVKFINGAITNGDGYLEANIKLQFSTNGSTWADSNWTISPAYPYTSDAAGVTYIFSGTAVGVKGVRVVGQVAVLDRSYFWTVKEIQIYGATN